jgi:hypothetical protein
LKIKGKEVSLGLILLVMNKTIILIGLLTLILIWLNLWASTRIITYLKSKGIQASMFRNGIFIKGKIFKYLPVYKKTSLEHDGKVGHLYYLFYTSFILSLLSFGLGLLLIS